VSSGNGHRLAKMAIIPAKKNLDANDGIIKDRKMKALTYFFGHDFRLRLVCGCSDPFARERTFGERSRMTFIWSLTTAEASSNNSWPAGVSDVSASRASRLPKFRNHTSTSWKNTRIRHSIALERSWSVVTHFNHPACHKAMAIQSVSIPGFTGMDG
jgi:hypothetical protein